MNKKAGAESVIAIIGILFTIAILMFVVNFAAKTFVTAIVAVPVINQTSPTSVTTFNAMSTTVDRFDYLFFGLFIGLFLGTIISSWYLGSNPIFVFFYFLVMLVAIPMSTILANAWDDLANIAVFGSTRLSFPITDHILSYLPYYAVTIGVVGMVIIFVKPFLQKAL